MPEFEFLTYETHNRVGYISLNRPKKRNALNGLVVLELIQAFTLAEQAPEVKVIVLKAKGKVFCAGADLEYLQFMQTQGPEETLQETLHFSQLMLMIYRSTKVVIAQVEGHATAGGAGLVTACDFSFAVPEAKIGYPEVQIGFIPAIVMVFLLRKLGETRTKELLLSGDLISADRAERYNLITRVIPEDQIKGYVTEFAERICSQNSQASMQLTKKMIADIQEFPLENAVNFATKMNAHIRNTPDFQRGVAAFLNKEKITW